MIRVYIAAVSVDVGMIRVYIAAVSVDVGRHDKGIYSCGQCGCWQA